MIPVQRSPDPSARVLLLEGIHSDAADRFRQAGYHVDEVASSLSEEELIVRLQGVTVLGVRSKTRLPRRVIESTSGLTAVGAFCIGTNQIDLDACLDRGIAVFNAPFANTRSVVEMALGEMIVLIRDIARKNALLHQGIWEKRSPDSREIRGKRLGIVGYGNIGAQLSVLAEGLGMEVQYFDVSEKLALGNARMCRSLDELLETSDVVTIHVDGDARNDGLIGSRELSRMKPGAILINLSRGFVVDLEALRAVLESGHLKGAAVDVFPSEPRQDGSAFESPLRGLPNVILTPHVGGSTQEAQQKIGAFVPEKLLDFLETGTTTLSVNFPNLQLPEFRESHRLVHVHRNEPGVLARLNRTMADRNLNITGQYLKTNESIGYVITDIGRDYDQEVVSEVQKVPGTIRVRVLY